MSEPVDGPGIRPNSEDRPSLVDRDHGVDSGRHHSTTNYDQRNPGLSTDGGHEEHEREREHEHEHEHDHDHHATDLESVGVAVATVSTTRSIEDDRSGDEIIAIVEDAGFEVVTRELIPDDHDAVQRSVDAFTRRDDVDVIITTGGTGVTPDDVTVEAVSALFEKELPGFGELFRRLSYDEVGPMAVASRAIAGIADTVVVFCLPGSIDAVRLGTESIIVDIAPHLAGLANPDTDEEDPANKS